MVGYNHVFVLFRQFGPGIANTSFKDFRRSHTSRDVAGA